MLAKSVWLCEGSNLRLLFSQQLCPVVAVSELDIVKSSCSEMYPIIPHWLKARSCRTTISWLWYFSLKWSKTLIVWIFSDEVMKCHFHWLMSKTEPCSSYTGNNAAFCLSKPSRNTCCFKALCLCQSWHSCNIKTFFTAMFCLTSEDVINNEVPQETGSFCHHFGSLWLVCEAFKRTIVC